MRYAKVGIEIADALSLVGLAAPAYADPVKNIVLVHGAWLDAPRWNQRNDGCHEHEPWARS
jgi:hypothetical protein